jgi:hypothetical protein
MRYPAWLGDVVEVAVDATTNWDCAVECRMAAELVAYVPGVWSWSDENISWW